MKGGGGVGVTEPGNFNKWGSIYVLDDGECLVF